MKPEITIIGFPKCGTSALIRRFEAEPEMRTLRSPEGSMEISWPLIRDIRPEPGTDRILVHKLTVYVYNRAALEYLVGVNTGSLLVLCIRDPLRALVSWHNMHRSIARSGKNPEHFAWKERDFYSECTLSDYYARFAQRRLQYDKHLLAALSIIPKDRLAVVSQERMAQDMGVVAEYLKALARDELVVAQSPSADAAVRHEGFADKADIVVDASIRQELEGVQNRLSNIITKDVIHKCT